MGVFTGWALFANANTPAASTVDLKSIAQDLKLDDLTLKAIQVADQTSPVADGDTRETHQIQLVQSEVGTIQFSVNGPVGFMTDNTKRGVLFIANGVSEVSNLISSLETSKNLIVVSYTYPVSQKEIDKDASSVSRAVRLVPGQIALALEWLSTRKYVETERLSAMGFDIGGLFLPVSIQLANLRNISVASTILAYSGASLNQMASVTKGYDSRPFLPGLKGPFLTIYGSTDALVSTSESKDQYDLLSDPKSIQWIDGGHLTNKDTQAIAKISKRVLNFLGQGEE